MSLDTFHPTRGWQASSQDAVYNTAARSGESDTMVPLDSAVDLALVGQTLSGGDYYVRETLLEFDLSDIAYHDISLVQFVLTATTDLTITNAWTARLRIGTWPIAAPTEASFVGSGGLTSNQLLAHYTMADPDDLPTGADVWTDDNLTGAIVSVTKAGTTAPQVLRCYLHSSRHQAEIAPADGEQWDFLLEDIDLIIEHNAPVTEDEIPMAIPAPVLTVVDKPKESVTFALPAPVLSLGNMTGPVTANLVVPAPAVTATTVRRYQRDELFGFIPDDGLRIGRVV